MGYLAGKPLFRMLLAVPLAILGLLAWRWAALEPWALLVTAALIVGLAQQTLP
jgi:hypothetical protein